MQKFEPNELEKRVDEVLFYIWDPIGVSPDPYARAEYKSYVVSILGMVQYNKSTTEIAEYLCKIVSESMELPPNKEKAIEAAELLKQNKSAIDEGCA